MWISHVGWRAVVGAAALTTLVVGARFARRETPVAEAPPALSLASQEPVAMSSVRLTAEYRDDEPAAFVDTIPASGACRRPSELEQLELGRRIALWIERSYPHEHYDPPEIRVGCMEREGIIVDAHADRWTSDGNRHDMGRWWTLRVSRDRIVTLVESTGIAMNNWMEWEVESSTSTLALADLDRDGALDAISVRQVHEGGSIRSDFDITVIGSRRGAVPVAALRDVTLELLAFATTPILGTSGPDGGVQRRCISRGLQLTRC